MATDRATVARGWESKLKVKRLLGQHSPADGTLPEVPAADCTASIASLEGLFKTTETSSARRRNPDAGWKADLLKMASHLSGGKARKVLCTKQLRVARTQVTVANG